MDDVLLEERPADGALADAMHRLDADRVVASETASFGQPEVLLGLMPGGGATQRLTRRTAARWA